MLPDLHEGSPFSASDQNAVRRQLRDYTPFIGGPGIVVRGSPNGGKTIALANPPAAFESAEAILVDPENPADRFTDERYWIKPLAANQQETDNDRSRLQFVENTPPAIDETPASPYPLVASNLCEMPRDDGAAQSHLLPVGLRIRYFVTYDQFGVKRCVFFATPARAVLVQVDTPAPGAGKYDGFILNPPDADASPDSDLTSADFGSAVEPALILNATESGASTHDLTQSSSLQITFVGYLLKRNADGKAVVVINGFQTEDCT